MSGIRQERKLDNVEKTTNRIDKIANTVDETTKRVEVRAQDLAPLNGAHLLSTQKKVDNSRLRGTDSDLPPPLPN
jgi:hypothetical protein